MCQTFLQKCGIFKLVKICFVRDKYFKYVLFILLQTIAYCLKCIFRYLSLLYYCIMQCGNTWEIWYGVYFYANIDEQFALRYSSSFNLKSGIFSNNTMSHLSFYALKHIHEQKISLFHTTALLSLEVLIDLLYVAVFSAFMLYMNI